MRRLFLSCLTILAHGVLLLADGYDAVILEHRAQFVMQSLENGTLTIHRSIQVLSENGLDAATLLVYTDRSQDITAFSGTVTAGGKKETLKKKDLVSVSIASGVAEDGFMTGYRPRPSAYPFTVTYDYTVQYKKGFAVFPSFVPVQSAQTRMETGSYRLTVPAGTQVRHYTTGPIPEPALSHDGKNDVYSWEIHGYDGFVQEHNMPPVTELIPSVHASPDRFVFDGVPGSQDSWQSIGKWQYQLLAGTDTLPQETINKVHEMTGNTASDLDVVRILYRYLRESTRYVSIQFGIGGFKPFPAATVVKTGFGDCKALSNYFKSLLSAAGVDAEYTILNTEQAKLRPGYASFGQTDHAMLAVPLKRLQDTLWVECTAPTLPLGYRHTDIAGHEVILIGPEGGQMVNVRPYPDSVRTRSLHLDIQLREDGSATLRVERKATADEVEPWVGYDGLDDDRKRSLLVSGLDGQAQNLSPATLQDNFDSYDGPDWYPVCEVSYQFDMRVYGRKNGDRLMVPVNPFSKRLLFQRSERIHPYVSPSSSGYTDGIILRIPQGYAVESVPADVRIDQVWGTFESRIRQEDGCIIITQSVQMKACREAPDCYPEYREFVRALNKAYSASLVLRKQV